MKYAIGWMRTKPGLRDDFLVRSRSFVEATRAEDGVVTFELLSSHDDPDLVVAIETYASPEAHEAHRATAHFPEFRALLKSHVAGGRFESVVATDVETLTFGTF
jgi:quinol monooxygenase YgiN